MTSILGTYELNDSEYEGLRVITPTHAFVLIRRRGKDVDVSSAVGVYHLAGDILTFYPQYYSRQDLAVPLTWRVVAHATGVDEEQIRGDGTQGDRWKWRRVESLAP